MHEIAIDFGTTRTKLAKYNSETGKPDLIEFGRKDRPIIPSIFYIPPEGEVLIGDDAQDELSKDPAGIVRGLKLAIDEDNKIRLNGRKFDRIELLSKLFSYVRKNCETDVFFGEQVNKCTLTVPVSFSPFKRDCIKKSLKLAGFEKIKFIEEPISAAFHWMLHSDKKTDYIVVCDIGGGTTDIALLQRDGNELKPHPEVPYGDFPKGGNSIDEAIWEYVLDNIPEDQIAGISKKSPGYLIQLKNCKELISRKTEDNTVSITIEETKFPLSKNTVQKCSEKFSERVCDTLSSFIKDMKDNGIDKAPILLVGGGRYILGLKEAIENLWHKEVDGQVYTWQDSEYATVLGALLPDKQNESVIEPKSSEQANSNGKEDKYYNEAFILWQNLNINTPATMIHNYNTGDVCINCGCSRTAIESNGWACKATKSEQTNKNKQLEKIIEECNISLDFNNQYSSSIFLKASAQFRLGKFQQVNETLSSYDILSVDMDFSYLNALAYLQVEDFEKAKSSLEDAGSGNLSGIYETIFQESLTANQVLWAQAYVLYMMEDDNCLYALDLLITNAEQKKDFLQLTSLLIFKTQITIENLSYDIAEEAILKIYDYFTSLPKKDMDNQFENIFDLISKFIDNQHAFLKIWRKVIYQFNITNLNEMLLLILRNKSEGKISRDNLIKFLGISQKVTSYPWLSFEISEQKATENLIQRGLGDCFVDPDYCAALSGDLIVNQPKELMMTADIFCENGDIENANFCLNYLFRCFQRVKYQDLFQWDHIVQNKSKLDILFPNLRYTEDHGAVFNGVKVFNDSIFSVHNVNIEATVNYVNGKKKIIKKGIQKLKPSGEKEWTELFPDAGFFGRNVKCVTVIIYCNELSLYHRGNTDE